MVEVVVRSGVLVGECEGRARMRVCVCLCFCKMKRKENKLKKRERWPCHEGGKYCENEWWEISGVGGACLDLKISNIFFIFYF